MKVRLVVILGLVLAAFSGVATASEAVAEGVACASVGCVAVSGAEYLP